MRLMICSILLAAAMGSSAFAKGGDEYRCQVFEMIPRSSEKLGEFSFSNESGDYGFVQVISKQVQEVPFDIGCMRLPEFPDFELGQNVGCTISRADDGLPRQDITIPRTTQSFSQTYFFPTVDLHVLNVQCELKLNVGQAW